MQLDQTKKKKLIKEIQNKYLPRQDDLKNIFLMNREIFGDNFYTKLENKYNDFETRMIYLVDELIDTEKLDKFLEIVRKIYPLFAQKLKSPSLQLTEILDSKFDNYKEIFLKAYFASKYKITKEVTNFTNAEKLISDLIDGKDSYIKFVVYLLLEEDLDIELKEKLNEWRKENITDNVYTILSEEIEKSQKEKFNPCLLIVITKKTNKYVLRCGLITNIKKYNRDFITNNDFKQLKIDKPDTDEKLTGVEEIVRNLIQECINITDNTPQEIHIFLPYELMNHPVYCWKFYQDEDKTIGGEYSVIVRCSEGLQGKDPRILAWQNKGKLLNSQLQELAENVFILGDIEEEKQLEKKLNKEKAIAVKITKVFNKKQPGELLWKSAVPVALWFRQQLENINNQVQLDCLLENCCLKELPEKVKEQRFDAMYEDCSEKHFGSHLCLLWDDPNFLPPEQFLKEINL